MSLTFRDVSINWADTQEPYGVTVAIGDGSINFDADYPYDERICFYFEDEAEYESAKTGYLPGIEFRIVEEDEQ